MFEFRLCLWRMSGRRRREERLAGCVDEVMWVLFVRGGGVGLRFVNDVESSAVDL